MLTIDYTICTKIYEFFKSNYYMYKYDYYLYKQQDSGERLLKYIMYGIFFILSSIGIITNPLVLLFFETCEIIIILCIDNQELILMYLEYHYNLLIKDIEALIENSIIAVELINTIIIENIKAMSEIITKQVEMIGDMAVKQIGIINEMMKKIVEFISEQIKEIIGIVEILINLITNKFGWVSIFFFLCTIVGFVVIVCIIIYWLYRWITGKKF